MLEATRATALALAVAPGLQRKLKVAPLGAVK
jgi:hypothetical protein